MKELLFAVKKTIPIFFTYLFIGIAFGVLMHDAGYGVVLTILSALLIYAGSMQIALVPLMTAGTSLAVLALTTLFINARHIFYGVGLIERFRGMGWRRPYMIFSLTDETYSVLCSLQMEDGLDENAALFDIALLDHCYWIFGCTLGAFAAELLRFDFSGIEFSATAFFLVVVVEQWRTCRSKLPFFVAAVCAAATALLFGADAFLVPALSASTLALLLLQRPIDKTEVLTHD